MNHFLIRVELHHDEHSTDYKKLHDTLYDLQIYRVTKITGSSVWYDLPTAEYLYKFTNLNDLLTFQLIENVVEAIIIQHGYTAEQIKKLYSITVTKVSVDLFGQLLMKVHLQPTTDPKKLPPGETL